MPRKESPPQSPEELEFATLSAGNKVGILLEVFDLAPDKEKTQERKNNFIDLMKNYYYSVKRSRINSEISGIESSEKSRSEIHNKIMGIIRGMSLTQKTTSRQHALAEWLARDRARVTEMIEKYFSIYHDEDRPAGSIDSQILQEMRRGGRVFKFGKKEDED